MVLWNKSGDSSAIKVDQQIEIELTAKIRPNDIILIEAKIYSNGLDEPRVLKATPSVFTKNGNPAIIEIGSDNPDDRFSSFRMKVLPRKLNKS